jgi:hypothetical protein
VIQARRVLLDVLDNVAAGKPPLGVEPPADFLDVVPTDVVIPPSGADDRVGSSR